jgi:hypothetical protein
MRKSVLIFALAVMAAGLPRPAGAVGSNIALSEYPGPQCNRPEGPPAQPPLPPDENSSAAVAGFNLKVKQYNQAIAGYNATIAAFNVCMKTYIDNGNADMQRIKERLDAAVAAVNAH